ncbi:MAG: glucoamylase family protein, partial [Rudaea sp.]
MPLKALVRTLRICCTAFLLALGAGWQTAALARTTAPTAFAALPKAQQAAVNDLEKRTFDYFRDSANVSNGQIPDHWPQDKGDYFSSIAAVGFGLTAYGIGAERGWMTRSEAARRTLATLKFFHDAPQGNEANVTGNHGFFYHFLDMKIGRRYQSRRWVELSTIDTTLLLGGVLFSESYYDRNSKEEKQIRQLADEIYRRVDWQWASPRPPLVAMGWTPESGFIHADWQGYNEAMLLYVLALGSPTHAIDKSAWKVWTETYDKTWGSFQGQEHLGFAPLFGHQYSHVWIDFRGIQDDYMRAHGIDYFENSRRATFAQREYAIHNP